MVSHQTQRNGQPVSRTKTVGKPARELSPCRERKISLIFSAGGLPGAFTCLLFQTLFGGAGGSAIRILGHQGIPRSLRTLGVGEFLLASGNVEQRIGRFGVRWPFAGEQPVRVNGLLAVTQRVMSVA